jgi:type IV pilus assembly protein PilE
MMMNKRRTRGFSLIELAIVMVVIAILAAIALPSYRQYVLRGNRTQAIQALQDLASREESYFFSNSSYTQSSTNLGASTSIGAPYYSVVVASASSTDYTVTATAIGTQVADTPCATLSLNHAGQQFSNGVATAVPCWNAQ